MATSKGKSIRFKETDVRPMGRNARGVIGIRMAEDDRLVEMEVLSGKPDILSVTANGYGKRTAVARVPAAGARRLRDHQHPHDRHGTGSSSARRRSRTKTRSC